MDLLALSGYASSSSSSSGDDGGDGTIGDLSPTSIKFPTDNSAFASIASGLTTDDGGTTDEGDGGDSVSEQPSPFPTTPSRPIPSAPAPVPIIPVPVTPAPATPASRTPMPVTPAPQTPAPVAPSLRTPATAMPAPASTPLRCSGREKPWPVLYKHRASRVTENGVITIHSPREMTRLGSYGRQITYDDEDEAIHDDEDEAFDEDEDEALEGRKKPLLASRAPPLKSAGRRKRLEGSRPRRQGRRASRSRQGPTKRSKRMNLSAERFSAGEQWRVVDAGKGDAKFGAGIVTEMRVVTRQAPEDSLLSFFLKNRMRVAIREFSQDEMQHPFERVITDTDGNRFELVSVKEKKDESGPRWTKKTNARVVYALVSGPGLEDLCLKRFLLGIADFSALSTRKAQARLELLQSPAAKFDGLQPLIFFLPASDFCTIPDEGNEGCGFIEEELLSTLLGGTPTASRKNSVQVRFGVSFLGLGKGMLMRKKIVSGPPIQIPSSMVKVGPSKEPTSPDTAFLLVCSAGVHPSPGVAMVGRLLNPDKALGLPPKSFKPKGLDDMIPRVWRGLGVPKVVCNRYVEESREAAHLKHTYLGAVADPTGEIPHDVVFVTEASARFKKDGIEKVFVTRSPCIKTSDGCVVPVLVDRPDEMSEESWAWLNGLSFGNIIFGRPKPGTTPLVTRIAKSDMDGDRLFVCWEKAVVHGVRRPFGEKDPVAEQLLEEEEDVRTAPNCGEDWLERVQNKMSESSVVMEEIATLKSALWRLSAKAADESMPPLKSAAFMSNPDSIAYADAFYQALEFMKHGRKIILPARLHKNLKKRLRKHLSAS